MASMFARTLSILRRAVALFPAALGVASCSARDKAPDTTSPHSVSAGPARGADATAEPGGTGAGRSMPGMATTTNDPDRDFLRTMSDHHIKMKTDQSHEISDFQQKLAKLGG